MGGTCLQIVFGGNISFPSFELRRNSIMLMLKNTFISSSQNGERFPLNRKFAQAALLSCTVFHHRQNVLMMIYLPKYYNCARSLDSVCVCACAAHFGRLFSSLLLFVQEFIDPVSKCFCFLQSRAARIAHNREGSNDHDSQVFVCDAAASSAPLEAVLSSQRI